MDRELTILVMDDRQHDIEMVKRLLADIAGVTFHTHSCQTPDQARTILASRSIDLLILDHKLSAQTGFQFLSEKNLHDLPVVVISGFLNAEETMRPYEEEPYAFLNKTNLTPQTLQIGISNSIYRHRLEEHLHDSTQHKNLLMKEVHHRVTNNTQLISSPLGLQVNYQDEEDCKQLLNKSKRRVQSLGLVHRIIYKSDNFSSLDAGVFLRNLVGEISRSFTSVDPEVSFLYEMDPDVRMGLDTAIPCSLVVSELVTNALLHAVKEGTESHHITIQLREPNPDQYDLSVFDEAPGLPEDVDPRNARSLGLRLVFTLAENQLDADIEYESTNGTTFRIQFPAR